MNETELYDFLLENMAKSDAIIIYLGWNWRCRGYEWIEDIIKARFPDLDIKPGDGKVILEVAEIKSSDVPF